jgi:hypothetical protein
MEVFENTRFTYRTDSKGAVTGIGNSKEVASLYDALVERMLAEVIRSISDPLLVESFRAGFEPMRRGPYMEHLALELPRLLHFFSGRTIDASKRYSQNQTTRLRLDGTEVPSSLSYELAWFDRTKNIAWLRWIETADRRRTAVAAEAFVRGFASKAGQRLPRRLDIGPSSITDEAEMFNLELFDRREIRLIQ